jgi:quinolinate synthase
VKALSDLICTSSNAVDLADFIGSTSALFRQAEQSSTSSFIVLTEPGILHQMRLKLPQKQFFEVPGADGCSCNACPYMRLRALAPIEKMLAMSL